MKYLLALCLLFCASCAGNTIVFVREDVDVDGNPRQLLKTTEGVEMDVVYFDGEEWILAEDVLVPAGWIIASPKLIKEK